jgi:hypothetical protein
LKWLSNGGHTHIRQSSMDMDIPIKTTSGKKSIETGKYNAYAAHIAPPSNAPIKLRGIYAKDISTLFFTI